MNIAKLLYYYVGTGGSRRRRKPSSVVFFSHHYNTAHGREANRNGGPDEGMWTSHYLEGMGYECIPESTSRSLGSDNSDANRSAKKSITVLIFLLFN